MLFAFGVLFKEDLHIYVEVSFSIEMPQGEMKCSKILALQCPDFKQEGTFVSLWKVSSSPILRKQEPCIRKASAK